MIGSIANNRFLQRVNPQITRALADSGSSLEHSEIQQLMRQMVDLGIADNLKLWVHSGLVKTRTSGSDLFVPKVYDISGEENDAVQATEANQPKLLSDGMEFDGSNNNHLIYTPIATSVVDRTIMMWVYTTNIPSVSQVILSQYNANIAIGFFLDSSDNQMKIIMVSSVVTAKRTAWLDGYTGGAWNHIAFIIRETSNGDCYINGSETTYDRDSRWGGWGDTLWIGKRDSGNPFSGKINDIRIYNKVLSATEIAALYNQSKSKYGH